jgi:hypothetical protein
LTSASLNGIGEPSKTHGKKQKPAAIKDTKLSTEKTTTKKENRSLKPTGTWQRPRNFAGDFPPPAPSLLLHAAVYYIQAHLRVTKASVVLASPLGIAARFVLGSSRNREILAFTIRNPRSSESS